MDKHTGCALVELALLALGALVLIAIGSAVLAALSAWGIR